MPKQKTVGGGPAASKRQKAAIRVTAHARGGTHKVRDEYKTGTHWDNIGWKELVQALKARKGLYRKDLRKHEMAKLLADDDKRQALEDRKKEEEVKKAIAKLQKEKAKKEQQKANELKALEEKQIERENKRIGGYEVSDTISEDGLVQEFTGAERFGEIIDDDGSSEESSESETTSNVSAISPIFPHSKLRIFEWPFPDMPLPDPPLSPWLSPDSEGWSRERSGWYEETMPKKIPYAVMNLVTTLSKEVVELPGRTYPEPIGADFVPKLAQYVMNCARNGILIGTLRKAIIEKGINWAERTHIQWWNGRMYLDLPKRRNSAATLVDVYAKWNKQKMLKGKGVKTGKKLMKTSQHETEQKAKNKKAMMLDIYAASESRPTLCYAPVELEYPNVHEDGDGPRKLENLFYVRFPGMDLPHYYFWTRLNEWEDPTIPNPCWLSAKLEDEAMEREEELQPERENEFHLHVRPRNEEDPIRPYPLEPTKIRVKKSKVPSNFQQGQKHLPKTSKFNAALFAIERELYQYGFAAVLKECHTEWVENGKHKHWEYLIDKLPELYPSGELPNHPPVHQDPDNVPRSLAEKLACIEVPSHSQPVSPIQGDEPWTRDDNQYWEIVDAHRRRSSAPSRRGSKLVSKEADIQEELLSSTFDHPSEEKQDALCRRFSEVGAQHLAELDGWLQDRNSSYVTPSSSESQSQMSVPPSPITPVGKAFRAMERCAWEQMFVGQQQAEIPFTERRRSLRSSSKLSKSPVPNLVSQIRTMPVEELKWQVYTLMTKRGRDDRHCRVCLEPLDKSDLVAAQQHYQMHHDEADLQCPFCGLGWDSLDSEDKTFHIFSHDLDDSIHRRRSSGNTAPLYSIPAPSRRDSRRFSEYAKVDIVPGSSQRSSRHSSGAEALPDVSSSYGSGKFNSTNPQLLYSIPAPARRSISRISRPSRINTDLQPRCISKVHFSPKVIERRISYNDEDLRETYAATDAGMDADVDSVATTSPKKSSLKQKSKGIKKPSSFLTQVTQYSDDHPEARSDSRRMRSNASESIEYYTGHHAPRAKKTNAKTKAKVSRTKAKFKDNTGGKEGPEGVGLPTVSTSGSFDPLSGHSLGRKFSDTAYVDFPSASDSSSHELPRVPRKKKQGKAKVEDLTYRNKEQSSASSSAKSPVLRRPRRTKDPTYRYQDSDSSSATPPPVVKKANARKTIVPKSRRGKKAKAEPQLPTQEHLLSSASNLGTHTHNSSTMSNLKSRTSQRRKRALQSPTLDAAEIPDTLTLHLPKGKKRKAPTTANSAITSRQASNTSSQTGPPSKKRKVTEKAATVLQKRQSYHGRLQEDAEQGDEDYTQSIDAPLPEDSEDSEDATTCSSSAQPPRETKAEAKAAGTKAKGS